MESIVALLSEIENAEQAIVLIDYIEGRAREGATVRPEVLKICSEARPECEQRIRIAHEHLSEIRAHLKSIRPQTGFPPLNDEELRHE